MSDHSILADKVSECLYEGMSPRETTDALIAAGVRPPVQVITEPAELDEAAVVDMVVLDRYQVAWQCTGAWGESSWKSTQREGARASTLLAEYGPVTVLHVPTEVTS